MFRPHDPHGGQGRGRWVGGTDTFVAEEGSGNGRKGVGQKVSRSLGADGVSVLRKEKSTRRGSFTVKAGLMIAGLLARGC